MKLKKTIIREIFPPLKLKDKNMSFLNKLGIYANILANIFILTVISLYFLLPYIAQDIYKIRNMTFYQHEKYNDNNDSQYFKDIAEELSKNELYTKNIVIDFHLLNDEYIYTLFNPIEWLPNRETFAVTHNKNIFVKYTNMKKNKSYASSFSDDIFENLDAILIHEGLHAMQYEKYGWFYTSFKMPYWVKEGYPIYQSDKHSNYPIAPLLTFLQENPKELDNLPLFEKDKFYALVVKHAIEDLNKSIDDLHLGKVEYDEVLDSLFKEYNVIEN